MIPVGSTQLTADDVERVKRNCAHVLALPFTITPKLDAIIKDWQKAAADYAEREARRYPVRKPDAASLARLADRMREKT